MYVGNRSHGTIVTIFAVEKSSNACIGAAKLAPHRTFSVTSWRTIWREFILSVRCLCGQQQEIDVVAIRAKTETRKRANARVPRNRHWMEYTARLNLKLWNYAMLFTSSSPFSYIFTTIRHHQAIHLVVFFPYSVFDCIATAPSLLLLPLVAVFFLSSFSFHYLLSSSWQLNCIYTIHDVCFVCGFLFLPFARSTTID